MDNKLNDLAQQQDMVEYVRKTQQVEVDKIKQEDRVDIIRSQLTVLRRSFKNEKMFVRKLKS